MKTQYEYIFGDTVRQNKSVQLFLDIETLKNENLKGLMPGPFHTIVQ